MYTDGLLCIQEPEVDSNDNDMDWASEREAEASPSPSKQEPAISTGKIIRLICDSLNLATSLGCGNSVMLPNKVG